MIAQSKRLFQRQGCRLPIQYRSTEMDDYRDAVAYNCSMAGMYFELQTMMMPEEGIHIIMSTYSPSAEGPESFRYYLARTVWCRSIADDADPRYGCGVRLLKRSCQADGMNADTICHTCDMCGMLIQCQNLRKVEESLCLCPSCERHLAAIPEGRLKLSIKRLISGNVL
jgi:hypothetical protein